LAIIGGVSLLVGVAAGVFRGALLGLIAVLFGPFAGWSYLKIKVGKAKAAFEEQLPETLQLLAGSLRAGMSFVQALSAVGHEAPAPTKEELRKVLTENRLGRSVVNSLHDVVVRMDSKDFDWVVAAVEVHQEVGGNLADVLERVAATIRARNRVKGQVKALSAEGRLSGVILAILPPGVFMIMYMSNREYAARLIEEQTGQIILGSAMLLVAMGSVWLHRMARFKF
ncbi:MAG: type II secretion system F family protein, partial [Alphaproteobacteria bacterium]|nr:type II secretion system F family protein [Alphaproteobacteria bacterium]